ncbi:hypothetical protein [Microbulbifer sp. THAF38]|uniref:hypothetical protein n=1 Tax=Microbulbifer sp. THAF38 TaxID=2587856 RepID=UPI001268DE29|nr:hypothetical protein [Microbulbifer sp. THAF38]QFT57069.1 hypothetical protein FIU95_21190 [Microbulbifer sp. THAF38]
MAIYQCLTCEAPIQQRTAKFCTQCGNKIAEPVPQEFLIDGKRERISLSKLGFIVVWIAGAVALISNSESSSTPVITAGIIGLVMGGLYLSLSGPLKVVTPILIDKRKIICEN